MKIAILDDWHDTLRGLPCFAKLSWHEVVVFTDHVQDDDELARRLADADVLVLIRERTTIGASLLDRLDRLLLISQRGVCPHSGMRRSSRHVAFRRISWIGQRMRSMVWTTGSPGFFPA